MGQKTVIFEISQFEHQIGISESFSRKVQALSEFFELSSSLVRDKYETIGGSGVQLCPQHLVFKLRTPSKNATAKDLHFRVCFHDTTSA